MARSRQQSKAGPTRYHAGTFPPTNLDWSRLIPLIGPASTALARYDSLLLAIPNAAVLLSPLTTQEADLSSRIEGTQATMGEVLRYEASPDPTLSAEKREDIEEVLNYRRAMRQAVELLDKLPICNRLVKSVHETLLAGVRGHDKSKGKFRVIQNYIGVYGRPIDEARFVPIAPEKLTEGMKRWEAYVHGPEADVLVQLAIVHAEFEALHPFLDGNGRIGRMLVPLFLFDRKMLREPMFYLSEFLEANRQEYYDRLLAVSQANDWTGWCEFFLKGLRVQAEANHGKAVAILELYREKKESFGKVARSQYAIAALDWFFTQPIFKTPDFVEASKLPARSASRMVQLATEAGLLREIHTGKGRKATVLAFAELLNIAEGRDVF